MDTIYHSPFALMGSLSLPSIIADSYPQPPFHVYLLHGRNRYLRKDGKWINGWYARATMFAEPTWTYGSTVPPPGGYTTVFICLYPTHGMESVKRLVFPLMCEKDRPTCVWIFAHSGSDLERSLRVCSKYKENVLRDVKCTDVAVVTVSD